MSVHFSDTEFFRSDVAMAKGIDNNPPFHLRQAALFTLAGLERIRSMLGSPIQITSGYRCEQLNRLVGGSASSQHMRCEAVDFICPIFGTPRDICLILSKSMGVLGIDQLIMEGTWVHVSFTHLPRLEVLTKVGSQYHSGIV